MGQGAGVYKCLIVKLIRKIIADLILLLLASHGHNAP